MAKPVSRQGGSEPINQKNSTRKFEKTCFVICPIGSANSTERTRSDQLLKHIIEPVCSQAGYLALRADQFPDPGLITNQIIEQLVNADLVIADLTDRNPNVFYELGIRHCTGKPFIQIINEKAEVPFDIANVRTTIYNLNVDFVLATIADLSKQIEWIEAHDGKVANPVLLATSIETLLSGNPEEKRSGQIMELLTDVSQVVEDLQSNMAKIMGRRGRTSLESLESDIDDVKSAVSDIDTRLDDLG